MKNITKFIKEAAVINDYLLARVVVCDAEMSDYLLASYDLDQLSKGMINAVQKLITNSKIDVVTLTWKNVARINYNEIAQGRIIDVDGQLFIAMGKGDGVDKTEFNEYTGKGSVIEKKNYYISKSSTNEDYKKELDLDDIKKLSLKDWE